MRPCQHAWHRWALARQQGKRQAARGPCTQTWNLAEFYVCVMPSDAEKKLHVCVAKYSVESIFPSHVLICVNKSPAWTDLEETRGGRKENCGWKISDRCRSSLISINLPETTKKTSPTSSVPVMLYLLWTSTLPATLHDTVKTNAFTEPFERLLFQVVRALSLEVTAF